MKKINVKIIQAKNKYLNFLKSQEIRSEPFRDKLGQLKKFYLPISKMIKDEIKYTKKKITENFKRVSLSIEERKKIINTPSSIKIKCLKKKE